MMSHDLSHHKAYLVFARDEDVALLELLNSLVPEVAEEVGTHDGQ